jgi:hypothetical protein
MALLGAFGVLGIGFLMSPVVGHPPPQKFASAILAVHPQVDFFTARAQLTDDGEIRTTAGVFCLPARRRNSTAKLSQKSDGVKSAGN